jgi:hypothetical protein
MTGRLAPIRHLFVWRLAVTASLKETYGTIERLLAAYEQEIVEGAAHQRALAEMLRNAPLSGTRAGRKRRAAQSPRTISISSN